MKRLLLVTLTLLSLSAFSQNYAKVYIWEVAPDSAYQGDTITVGFKFEEPVQSPKIDTTFIQLYDNSSSTPFVWKDKWQNLYSYPKKEVGFQDSIYLVKIVVPVTTRPGDCRVYGRGGSYLPLYVKTRTATSIKTNKSELKIKSVRYFSLSGAELSEPVVGQKMIKVEVYEDDSFSSNLIMML